MGLKIVSPERVAKLREELGKASNDDMNIKILQLMSAMQLDPWQHVS